MLTAIMQSGNVATEAVSGRTRDRNVVQLQLQFTIDSYRSKIIPTRQVKMWKQQVKQTMFSAFDATMGIFERTVAEYEDKLARLRETERKFKNLEALINPRIVLNRIDAQQTVPLKEEAPQDMKPVVDQQVPETIHEKEEKMELESTVKTEQLNMKMETTEFSSPELPVETKKEDKPQQHQEDSGDPLMLSA